MTSFNTQQPMYKPTTITPLKKKKKKAYTYLLLPVALDEENMELKDLVDLQRKL